MLPMSVALGATSGSMTRSIGRAELANERRQPGHGRELGDAEAEPTGSDFAQACPLEDAIAHREQLRPEGANLLALRVEPRTPPQPVEELDPEGPLQLLNALRDRRLGRVEARGRALEAPHLGDAAERLQLLHRDHAGLPLRFMREGNATASLIIAFFRGV